MKFTLCIPTLNAAREWDEFVRSVRQQSQQPDRVIIIDSESTDGTCERARESGFELVRIARKDFRHGATRQLAVPLARETDAIVYMTQDAVLADADAFAELMQAFADTGIGAAYGRQLPRRGAGPIEAHTRCFNYPATGAVRTMDSVKSLGFRAIFFSNSFGAYRIEALQSVGGFPLEIEFGEDTVIAARMLVSGWKVAYAADARVFHSHGYSMGEEFRRCVEIGRLHAAQPWLRREFGGASGEGIRFVRSQCSHLLRTAPHLIPAALLRSAVKLVGYKQGLRHRNAGSDN